MRGLLHEDHHADVHPDLESTHGVVVGLQLVQRRRIQSDGRLWCPTPELPVLTEVPRVPHFAFEQPPAEGDYWSDDGVIAQLCLSASCR